MRYFPLIILLIISQTLFSEGEDKEYITPPLHEEPLTFTLFEEIPRTPGVVSSSVFTLTSLSLTVYNSYRLIDLAAEDLTAPEFQQGIVFTGIGFISTAVFSLILKYFILRE